MRDLLHPVSEAHYHFNGPIVTLAKLYLQVPTFDKLPCYYQLQEIARELASYPGAMKNSWEFFGV
jgi:hypothetical protein